MINYGYREGLDGVDRTALASSERGLRGMSAAARVGGGCLAKIQVNEAQSARNSRSCANIFPREDGLIV